MVQLSRSLSLLRSSVRLVSTSFSASSFWFCIVRVKFCLLCSSLTAVRHKLLPFFFSDRLRNKQTLTVDAESDDDRHQNDAKDPQRNQSRVKRRANVTFLFFLFVFCRSKLNIQFIIIFHSPYMCLFLLLRMT